jgi:rubrerythrin
VPQLFEHVVQLLDADLHEALQRAMAAEQRDRNMYVSMALMLFHERQ